MPASFLKGRCSSDLPPQNVSVVSPSPGSPTVPRGDPVSVYLFPGEAPKHRPSSLPVDGDEEEEEEEEEEEPDLELDGLVASATEAHADMLSQEGSEGSTDNDDFCILEAPGMGIPVRVPGVFYSILYYILCCVHLVVIARFCSHRNTF